MPNTMTVASAIDTFDPDAPSFSTTGAAAMTAETPQIDAPVATKRATDRSTFNRSPAIAPTASVEKTMTRADTKLPGPIVRICCTDTLKPYKMIPIRSKRALANATPGFKVDRKSAVAAADLANIVLPTSNPVRVAYSKGLRTPPNKFNEAIFLASAAIAATAMVPGSLTTTKSAAGGFPAIATTLVRRRATRVRDEAMCVGRVIEKHVTWHTAATDAATAKTTSRLVC
mmetsp:Transcript_21340/g.49646  ORF Transcript_21340/g.49646 Transcript_21340/m.49646 type:complete len:229 (+) Transcript_21340:607-1293(+)